MTEAEREAKRRYRAKGKRMTIDFYPAEQEMINYLATIEHPTTYIKQLIKKDMDAWKD